MVNVNQKEKPSPKKVPDWLNSSMWSSPPPPIPPPEESPRRSISGNFSDSDSPTTTTRVPPAPHQPPIRPDPPPPPPSKSKSNGNGNDTSTSNSNSLASTSSSSTSALSAEEISRQAQLLVEVSKKVINMREVRRLASMGIPDGPSPGNAGVRSTVWKLLLGYLPSERSLWSSELSKKRSQYKYFKDDLLMSPDTEIIEQIDRDVKRTHPDMQFFSGDTTSANLNQEALRNILMVFAKLNPGIRYVQGMNEILAPLFYVFRNDPDEENAAAAEADTFFCFVELLSGFRDNFCQQLDNSVVGIRSTITKLSLLLKEHDEELWRHLEVTCKETLLRICCAMLILIRRRLLAGDFTSNLKLLQNYPSTNISHLLYVANKLRAHPTS